MRARLLIATCSLIACVTAGAAESTPSQPAPTSAKWVTRKLHFMYSPVSPDFVTTHYSCDGLQDQMTSVLRQLGASSDLSVRSIGCTRPSGPEVFPGVEASFSVLEPAGAASSPTVTARWEKVTFKPELSCQLLDQVKRNVLPLFATRNVQAHCPADFSLEVLRPVKPAPGEAAPH